MSGKNQQYEPGIGDICRATASSAQQKKTSNLTPVANRDPAIGEGDERGQSTASAGVEGGVIVEPSSSPKTRIRYQFEAFCKKVISGERCDYLRELMRRSEWESSFSDLPTAILDRLYTMDDDPAEQFTFRVYGHLIPIRNDRLVESLLDLGPEAYSILLLAYALQISDREIGDLLGVSRSKIQRDRQKLFVELSRRMRR